MSVLAHVVRSSDFMEYHFFFRQDMKNQQVVSSLPKSVQNELSAPSVSSSVPQKFSHIKNVLVSPNGNCRVMDFHEESLSLAISQDSPHSSFMTGMHNIVSSLFCAIRSHPANGLN